MTAYKTFCMRSGCAIDKFSSQAGDRQLWLPCHSAGVRSRIPLRRSARTRCLEEQQTGRHRPLRRRRVGCLEMWSDSGHAPPDHRSLGFPRAWNWELDRETEHFWPTSCVFQLLKDTYPKSLHRMNTEQHSSGSRALTFLDNGLGASRESVHRVAQRCSSKVERWYGQPSGHQKRVLSFS